MFRSNITASKSPAAPYFPTYLLPSIKVPFLRRGRQNSTAASNDVPSLSSSPVSPTTTDDDFLPSLASDNETYTNAFPTTGDDDYDYDDKPAPPPRADRDRLACELPDVLRCNTCGTDVAYGLQVVSKGFTGRHGRALLVSAPQASPQPSCPGSPVTTITAAAVAAANSFFASTTPPGHLALARDGANLVNVTVGRPESRNLVTGAHVVADISCATCGVKIGWKYVDAREQAQKYKIGKFILETQRVVLSRSWEDGRGDEGDGGRHFYSSSAPTGEACSGVVGSSGRTGGRKKSCSSEGAGGADGLFIEDEFVNGESASEEEIAFDSDNSSECDDIFAGVWDAATVARRRGSKVSGASR